MPLWELINFIFQGEEDSHQEHFGSDEESEAGEEEDMDELDELDDVEDEVIHTSW